MQQIHESMNRLLAHAMKVTRGEFGAIVDFKGLQDRLGESSAVMTNWKTRGLSKDGALKAEREFGCSATWLLDGEGDEVAREPAQKPVWPFVLIKPEHYKALPDEDRQIVEKLAVRLHDLHMAIGERGAGADDTDPRLTGSTGVRQSHGRKIERNGQSGSAESQPGKKRSGR